MEAPDVAAFVVTLDGIVAGWGDGVATLLGYRAEEVIGREVSMFLPGEHPSHFPRILAATARGQRIETFETLVGRDGLRLEVALRTVPARNGDGQVTGARATLRDVTPERAEEAHAWLTALLESSHDGIYAVDGRGVIRNWSPGAERLYGYAAHEAVGLPYTWSRRTTSSYRRVATGSGARGSVGPGPRSTTSASASRRRLSKCSTRACASTRRRCRSTAGAVTTGRRVSP